MTASMTADEVRALPAVTDVRTAGRAFGLGRDASYELARRGALPVPVLRLGRRLVVTRSALLQALGIADGPTSPTESLHSGVSPQVSDMAADTQSAAGTAAGTAKAGR